MRLCIPTFQPWRVITDPNGCKGPKSPSSFDVASLGWGRGNLPRLRQSQCAVDVLRFETPGRTGIDFGTATLVPDDRQFPNVQKWLKYISEGIDFWVHLRHKMGNEIICGNSGGDRLQQLKMSSWRQLAPENQLITRKNKSFVQANYLVAKSVAAASIEGGAH